MSSTLSDEKISQIFSHVYDKDLMEINKMLEVLTVEGHWTKY